MNYISEDLEFFKTSLNEGLVTFKYKKKDGLVRTAIGTINKKIAKNYKDEIIKLERKIVDIVIKEHLHNNIFDYAENNDCVFLYNDDYFYYFQPKKRMREPNPNQTCYFDIEKQQSRSFLNENFLGIIKIENICLEEKDTTEYTKMDIMENMSIQL